MSEKTVSSHEKRAKAVLIEHLLSRNAFADDAVLINELALDNFSRRADLVVVNGSIEMFEIKSEADTLTRLPGQVETFLRYCDKLHVVSASRHIEEILTSTPEDVAVWELDYQKGIKVIRRGKKTPLTDKGDLLKMISAKELRRFLSKRGIKAASSLRKHLDLAAEAHIPLNELRAGVLRALKVRYAKTTDRFLGLTSLEGVLPNHLEVLKRPAANSGRQVPSHVGEDQKIEDDIYLLQLARETKGALFGVPPGEIRRILKST